MPGGAWLTEVDLVMTVAGTVETFDAASFIVSLATSVGVEPAAVTLDVAAASVRVAATIRVVGDADGVIAAVQALPSSAIELSVALGVTVMNVDPPTVSVRALTAPLPPPPPAPPPSVPPPPPYPPLNLDSDYVYTPQVIVYLNQPDWVQPYVESMAYTANQRGPRG